MPRTNYVPSRHIPVGYAHPYYTEQREDKPTVEVDFYDEGMEAGLIEAVIQALEFWEPTFDHYVDPPPLPPRKDGKEQWDPRMVPVFRGRHADQVLKFRDDIMQYIHAHQIEPDKNVILKIAAKYVHIRPMPAFGRPPLPHHNTTPYRREVIRPYVRRSDPEWDTWTVRAAQEALGRHDLNRVHECVIMILDAYDARHGTALSVNYQAEIRDLTAIDAAEWEHHRLVAYYVQEIADTWATVPTTVRKPAKKAAAKKAPRRLIPR